MGFSKELVAPWFQQLGSVLQSKTATAKGHKLECEGCADAFDAADFMERGGLAHELPTDLTHPVLKASGRQNLKVERSQDRLLHTLLDEKGAPLLKAHTLMSENRIDVFTCGQDPSPRAAFSVSFDAQSKTRWCITCRHCEKCLYRGPHSSCEAFGGQVLSHVKHYKETIGEGISLCMDADIPFVCPDASREVWCPLKPGPKDQMELTSKRPTWNPRLASLAMDFQGRIQCASAKNFQLCLDDQVILLFGKKKQGTFILEFEHPLSPAQAFGIALTTTFWT